MFTGVTTSCVAQTQLPALRPDSLLKSGALSVRVKISDNHFAGLSVNDDNSGRSLKMNEAFLLVLKDQTVLRSTDMQMSATLDATSASDPHRVLQASQQKADAPDGSCWNFTMKTTSAALQWCLLVRPESNYVREILQITAGNEDLPIAEVRLLEFADPDAHVAGSVAGSPVVDANMFFGMEHPLSRNAVLDGQVTASLLRDLPLRKGNRITYSAVLGTSRAGQLRRAFLSYIERERPRPYQPFLHYNSWYDLGYGNRFDEDGALNRIHAFGQELTVARHVQLDSFLFDDGWDDPHTLWGFDAGFPHGFTNVTAAAAGYHAGVGVWLSPWGGYDEQKKQRLEYGRDHGFEILNDGFALSGPKYFQRFEDTCLEMIDQYHVNQFKFDGTGNADKVVPGSAFDSDFDAAIHLIERLRQEKPSLFINLTTGTTASPFWLFYADSIWRGGDDHSFDGEGSARQRWITFRDAQTYKNIVQKGPLFPLNSLMLHGVIYASQAKDLATDPGNDFADEVHSYFGSGTQLQELYMTPSLLSAANWDTLAEAARWSRAHAETLKDVHWIGGDPDLLQPYGWAAWGSQRGILTLRNPSKKPQTFAVDVARVFELDKTDSSVYQMHSVWTGSKQWRSGREMRAGKTVQISLAPFEVLTLEGRPVR